MTRHTQPSRSRSNACRGTNTLMVQKIRPSSYDESLSTISVRFLSSKLLTDPVTRLFQSDSMVEIKHSDVQHSPFTPVEDLSHEDEKYRLVYSKSKVYVNPTAYARDNIPGFVALVKKVRGSALNYQHVLVFIKVVGIHKSFVSAGLDP
jgi:hypothetical protein